jgi:hypothetical protein
MLSKMQNKKEDFSARLATEMTTATDGNRLPQWQ